MKLLGYLLLVSAVLAAIKAAVTALAVAAAVAGIVCLIRQPRQTLMAVAMISATFAFVAHPIVVMVSIGTAAVLSRLTSSS